MFDDTLEVLTAGTKTDAYGDDEPDWDNPTAVPVSGEMQPLSSVEAVLTTQTVVSRWRAFLDPVAQDGTTVTLGAENRIRHDGTVYEVDGRPDAWRVAGQVDHFEAFLKLVED